MKKREKNHTQKLMSFNWKFMSHNKLSLIFQLKVQLEKFL